MATRKQKPVALFLGAGASRTFGVPLTREILREILQKCREQTLFGESPHGAAANKRLLASLQALLPGLDVPGMELPLITDLISLIDYSLSVSTTPIRGVDQRGLLELRSLLARAIAEIVDIRPWPHKKETTEQAKFQQWSRWLVDLSSSRQVSVLTSNYDIVSEQPILRNLWGRYISERKVYRRIDFGLAWHAPHIAPVQRRPKSWHISFFKLHGSVNWLACEVCEHIYIQHWSPIYWLDNEPSLSPSAASTGRDRLVCRCDHGPLSPVIVAPSLVRDIRNPSLLEIWKNALEALRAAEEWIIIGYSFPPEDLAIRSMFVRAWQSRKRKPKVTVVQHGNDFATRSRYIMLFPECEYLTNGLEGYLETVAPPS